MGKKEKTVINIEHSGMQFYMAKDEKLVMNLTEQTVREMLKAIEDAKSEGNTINHIMVSSDHSRIAFQITTENEPNAQESLGYRLTYISHPSETPSYRGRITPAKDREECGCENDC